jgi:hypothetical protein
VRKEGRKGGRKEGGREGRGGEGREGRKEGRKEGNEALSRSLVFIVFGRPKRPFLHLLLHVYT